MSNSIFNIINYNGIIQKTTSFKIRWSDLKNKRDHHELIPGCIYIIVDYSCDLIHIPCKYFKDVFYYDCFNTVNFLIEVIALDDHTLSEDARELNNNLIIKYSLDCDNSRFDWVDEDCYGGVIYYMKDEFGNEAPYDFKNIMFPRLNGDIYCDRNLIGAYFFYNYKIFKYSGYPNNYIPCIPLNLINDEVDPQIISDGFVTYFYTFNAENFIIYNNIIKPSYDIKGKQILNDIVFCAAEVYDNYIDSNCYGLSIYGDFVRENTFGKNNKYIVICGCETSSNHNIFGNYNSHIYVCDLQSTTIDNSNKLLFLDGITGSHICSNSYNCQFIGDLYRLKVGNNVCNVTYNNNIYVMNKEMELITLKNLYITDLTKKDNDFDDITKMLYNCGTIDDDMIIKIIANIDGKVTYIDDNYIY